MRDPKRLEVYHLLDGLLPETYMATRALPANEQTYLGNRMRETVARMMNDIVHGCATKNAHTFIPYVENAHAHCLEFGQHVRICKRCFLLPEKELSMLETRYQNCERHLTQLRHTLMTEEIDWRTDDAWESRVAEDPPAKLRRQSSPRLTGNTKPKKKG